MPWNPSNLPDQTGRVFVVTGGNAGLGYFTVEQLARTGARVILASRNKGKADAAIATIRAEVPDADLGFVELDLSSLASVREVTTYLGGVQKLDGLVLNAGMTMPPAEREVTADGNEATIAANYLGHFALTAGVMPALERAPASRVVGLGSMATRITTLDPTDLQSERRYSAARAYGLSKHDVHGFILELDRRLRAAGSPVSAVLAHPGLALDSLSLDRDGITASGGPQAGRLMAGVAQGKNRGAAPIVRALLDPSVVGGDAIGPRWALKGFPVHFRPVRSSASPAFGAELWRLSEAWTGTEFALQRDGSWPLRTHEEITGG